MPLGLCALVAVGVHAGADVIDDRLLRVAEWLDTRADGILAHWAWTQPLVRLIDLKQCRLLARALTFLLELCTDAALAIPMLGYRELARPGPSWRALMRSTADHPTTLRLLRPAMTAAVVLAGTCAVARMVEGEIYLGLHSSSLAHAWSRLGALATLGLVLLTFGWRAVLRSFQHADRFSESALKSITRIGEDLAKKLEVGPPKRRRFRMFMRAAGAGLVGTAVALPLALEALLEASPLLSFFR